MTPKGRQSAAALSVVTDAELVHRVAPPPFLSDEQRLLWVAVINTKPADWFAPDSAPLLVEYVRAVETCNLLEHQVRETMAGGDPSDIAKILGVRDKEARRAAALAASLRLTQQSRYTPQAAATANKRAQGAAKPWTIQS